MVAHHHYAHPATPGNAGSDVEILNGARIGTALASGLIDDAVLGAVAIGGVKIDDPNAAFDFVGDWRYYITEDAAPAGAALSGTLAKTALSTTITGTGSLFTTELAPGREIVVPGGGGTDYLYVAAIASDTSLTVANAAKYTAAGQSATSAGDQMLWTGYIGDQDIERGEEFVGAGRSWLLSLAEVNSFLHFRVLRTTHSPNRPAETVAQRITWLLGVAFFSDTLFDEGLVQYPSDPLDKNDYTNTYPDQVLMDLSNITGMNHGVYYHEATGHLALFFGFNRSQAYSSVLRFSNIDTDFTDDGITFLALRAPDAPDAKLVRKPGRVASAVVVKYTGGTDYEEEPSTSFAFAWRDIVAPTSHIKTAAPAKALALRLLADNSTQDLLLIFSVWLPASRVTAIRKWQRFQARFSHLPGLTDWSWCRLLQKTTKQPKAEGGFYLVEIQADVILPCKPCTCSISPLAFGDARLNRLASGYPSTTDALEAFADIQNHIPAPWLTDDTWADSAFGPPPFGPNPYLAGTCAESPIATPDGNPGCGSGAADNGGRLTFTLQYPAASTSYHVVYGGSSPFDFVTPAFPTAPRANVIEIARVESGTDPSSLTLVVDGVTVASALAATFTAQARTNNCPTGTDSITPRVTRFVLPAIAQGRTWNVTLPDARGVMEIAGYLDPDDGTCA